MATIPIPPTLTLPPIPRQSCLPLFASSSVRFPPSPTPRPSFPLPPYPPSLLPPPTLPSLPPYPNSIHIIYIRSYSSLPNKLPSLGSPPSPILQPPPFNFPYRGERPLPPSYYPYVPSFATSPLPALHHSSLPYLPNPLVLPPSPSLTGFPFCPPPLPSFPTYHPSHTRTVFPPLTYSSLPINSNKNAITMITTTILGDLELITIRIRIHM